MNLASDIQRHTKAIRNIRIDIQKKIQELDTLTLIDTRGFSDDEKRSLGQDIGNKVDILKKYENAERQLLNKLRLLEQGVQSQMKQDLDNLDEKSPIARYHLGFGKETRPKTKWQELISSLREQYPDASLKDILIHAKTIYKK